MTGESPLLLAAEKYAEAYPLRAAAQLIPVVGGAIDSLIGGAGTAIQQRRILLLLQAMQQQLDHLEGTSSIPTEDLHDILLTAFNKVARTSRDQKIELFARIVSGQVISPHTIEEAETALQMLDSLDLADLEVLRVTIDAPICDGAFVGRQVVTLRTGPSETPGRIPPVSLAVVLPHIESVRLFRCCAKLIAAGLLHDEGVGRLDTGALEFFVPTDLARWFLLWIEDRKPGTPR